MGWGPEDQERQDEIDAAVASAIEPYKQRAEAAEARIKASQEPVGYRCEWPHTGGDNYAPGVHIILIEIGTEDGDKDYVTAVKDGYRLDALYAAPVIPPDVAELQRENAELTRKLEEQGEIFDAVLAPRETSIAKLREHFLAEAKSKAVPEGWKLVPRYPTEKMHRKGAEYKNATSIYQAMLAAAPQPRGSNE